MLQVNVERSGAVESVANVTDIHEVLDLSGERRGSLLEGVHALPQVHTLTPTITLDDAMHMLTHAPPIPTPPLLSPSFCRPPCRAGGRHTRLGIWSIQWSADSREIVAGTSDPGLRVYDMTQVGADRCRRRSRGVLRCALGRIV